MEEEPDPEQIRKDIERLQLIKEKRCVGWMAVWVRVCWPACSWPAPVVDARRDRSRGEPTCRQTAQANCSMLV